MAFFLCWDMIDAFYTVGGSRDVAVAKTPIKRHAALSEVLSKFSPRLQTTNERRN